MKTSVPCVVVCAILSLVLGSEPWAADNLVLGKRLLVKDPTGSEERRLVLVIGKENPLDFVFSNSPVPTSASLRLILNGTNGSDTTYALGAPGVWTVAGPGVAGVLKYTGGDPVKLLLLKETGAGTFILKAKLKGNAGAASLDALPPNPGSDGGIIVTIDQGFGPQQFCVAFGGAAGGTVSANDAIQWKVTNAIAQPGCPVSGGTSTTTLTSSTTTTTTGGGPCCGGAGFHSFTTNAAPGDCGDIVDVTGAMPFGQLACGGLYLGGGQSGAPSTHPAPLPDQTNLVTSITSCSSDVATLGAAMSASTGSNRTCTAPGCKFGAPVPIVITDPGTDDLLFCLVGTVTGSTAGTLDCSSGAETLNLSVSWDVYLDDPGDGVDPMHVIPGNQPCPICQAGTCVGGPNNGMVCTAGSSALGAAFPTSQDCPPSSFSLNGTIAQNIQLTTGGVTWVATPATNDPGSTVADMTRVFAGYCRDADGTGAFEVPPHRCWENGMAVGSACAGVYETCEQRNNGAFFGPGGGAVKTITVIGAPLAGISGGAASGTLVSIFGSPSIGTVLGATADPLLDVPGPGAVGLRGTGSLCAVANPCP